MAKATGTLEQLRNLRSSQELANDLLRSVARYHITVIEEDLAKKLESSGGRDRQNYVDLQAEVQKIKLEFGIKD